MSEHLADTLRDAGRRVTVGRILSGTEDIVDTTRRVQLTDTYGGLCVDWESTACAQVCNWAGVPVAVVRVISDGAYEATASEFVTNVGVVTDQVGRELASLFLKHPSVSG